MSALPPRGWSLESVTNSERLPVLADCDVLVVGAGAAGVAAATVAAEGGASVILLEKYGFAGGAAVAGMSGTICGLYLASDDERARPRQIVSGFTDRFITELAHRGGLTAPQRYGKTFTRAHDPYVWRDAADALLTDAGVRIIYHATVVDVACDGLLVTGVTITSSGGMTRINARRIIDASGDAALVARAGGRYFFGRDGRIQNPTMFFRLGNVDTHRFWDAYGPDTICPPWVTERITADRAAVPPLPRNKIWVFATPHDGELLVNATRLTASDGRMLNVIDPEDFTIAEVDGRRQVRSYFGFLRRNLPGCGDAHLIDTGVEAGIRQTRTIAGAMTLTNDDVVSKRKRPDGIARSAWPIEIHDGEKPTLEWLIDDWYEVPFLALVPETLEGIIVAGRSLSAEHEALASARVTAQCFEYGHAAAVATLRALRSGERFRDIPGADIRAAMASVGSSFDYPNGIHPIDSKVAPL